MVTLADFENEWYSSSEFIMAHTSGSTGVPKPILLPKRDMLVSANATNTFFGINENSVLATPLSLDYIAGKMMAVRSFLAGCELLLMPASNKFSLTKQVSLLAIVPSQIDSLLSGNNPTFAQNIIIGGAPLTTAKRRELAREDFSSFITYGMTETCSHVALAKVTEESTPFLAMPGISFTTDERGCLGIVDPEYSFGTLQTNDVVELIDSKSFFWKGRADNVINSGGLKIHPEILENQIRNRYPEFPPFYIIGRPSSIWGMEAVMVVEATESQAAALLSLAASAITDKRLRPKAAVAVSKLPQTPGGNKVKRILP